MKISNEKSIREISRIHDMSSTAVIRKIDQLEHYFRVKIFDRDNGIRLTENGELLQKNIPLILKNISNVHTMLAELRNPNQGKVVIYAGGSVVVDLLSPALCSVQKKYPNIEFEIVITSSSNITKAVVDGTADIGITIFAPETNSRLVHACHQVRHVVFVCPSHPFASREHVSFTDIIKERLAIPDQEFSIRRRLDVIAKYLNIQLKPVFTTSSLEMQRDLAVRNLALLILPEFCFSYECNAEILKKISILDGEDLNTDLEIIINKGRTLTFAARVVLSEIEASVSRLLSGPKSVTG
nr:LysR substrate-binding domain-containing protein [Neokomagataea tanensis]